MKLLDKILEEAPTDLCRSLINKLATTSFIDDPASYKYHHVYKHGLLVHSFELYHELKNLANDPENKKVLGKEFSDETIFLIAFGHDLEKIGSYKYNFSSKSYDFKFHKMFGMTHGEFGFDKLKHYLPEEFNNHPDIETIRICISGHMGDFERSNRGKEFYHNNIKNCPLLWLTHQADMKSCELNGEEFKELLNEE